jgi:tyrosine-protein kinase Etk/Wzc
MTPERSSVVALRDTFASLESTIDSLWTGLVPGGRPQRPLRLAFSACAHGDGATTIATCAAISLSRHLREEVVLFEANGRTPGLARMLAIDPGPGLDEVQRGMISLAAALRPTDVPGLSLVPWGGAETTRASGPRGPVPSELSREAGEELWDVCSSQGRHVLIDVAPILVHPGTIPLLWTVDATVAVWRAGRTLKQDAAHMVRTLASAGVPLAGTILNRHQEELPSWFRGKRRQGQS